MTSILAKQRLLKLFLDYETDAIIQESLRKEVAKDISVLTVAHRLHTVMDSDKIVSNTARKPSSLCIRANVL